MRAIPRWSAEDAEWRSAIATRVSILERLASSANSPDRLMPPDSPRAVFLSYASQDAGAVLCIADALRAAGVEVWLDQSELTGGDAWDRKIRGQIGTCALFAPVISAATQARREGYFRIEWKLAAQRTHAMADGRPFLLPIVIDDTKDSEALVPEEFRAVQWTRLPGGEKAEAFGARVRRLLGGSDVARAFQPVSSSTADTGSKAPVSLRRWAGASRRRHGSRQVPSWPSRSPSADIFYGSPRRNRRRARRRMRAQGRALPPPIPRP